MEPENRPNAALINKEWFDAASSVLSTNQLGIVIVNACRYVFGLDMLAGMNEVQGAVMAMIRPALDSDIVKYRERCARNAANARSGRERAAASGSEWQRVAANTTTTPTTTPTTTSTTTQSISDEERRKRERFEVFGYFWSIGSDAPKEELDAFWDYYESLGWKNNKGAVIVSKLAAARMWRRQFETKTPPNGAAAWYKAVKESSIPNPNIFLTFLGSEPDGDKMRVRLKCSENYFSQIKGIVPRLEPDLRAVWRGMEPIFETAG